MNWYLSYDNDLEMIIVREILTAIGKTMEKLETSYTIKDIATFKGSLAGPEKVKHMTQQTYP